MYSQKFIVGYCVQKMFSTSTQKKFWIFENQTELDQLREEARKRFLAKQNQNADIFLTAEEEKMLAQMVEETAQKFCESFDPPMPPSVVYIGFTYFKRVYLNNSVLEFLAKNIMMACLYLACKVDEFNVSIDEFVQNLKSGTRASNTEVILGLEAELMRLLRFHLTIHGPYRPLEGHLIEIKTRYPQISRPENMRKNCEEFLWKSLVTDISLLFPPSQIALAAILYSGRLLGYDIESYIQTKLCNGNLEQTDHLVSKLNDCIKIVQSTKPVTSASAAVLQEKAKKCMIALAEKQSLKRKSEDGGESFSKKSKVNIDDSDFDED